MIAVSDSFKQAMQAPVKILSAKATTVDGSITCTSADDLMSLDIESSGAFFNVTTKQATINLLGTDYDLIDRQVKLSMSVCTDQQADTWEDCPLGTFTITEQTVNKEKETTTLKGYDLMGVMGNTTYNAGELTFPCTVQNLAEQIAQRFSFTIDFDWAALPNYNYEITEDLYAKITGTTYRDIMAEIAGATAAIALISATDNNLVLTPTPTAEIEQWTYDNLKTIKFSSHYGPVNSVVISRTPAEDNIALSDDESIEANGLTEVKLANNEILDDERELVIQPIYDAVMGFEYTPFEATTEGHCWHETGDRIRVVNGDSSWDVVITYIKLTIDGGIKEQIKGVAPDATTTNYALAGGIVKTIYNTEIKVDKQNQEITSVVSQLDQLDDEVAENYTEIHQTINNITTTIQESGGANVIYNSVGYDTATDGSLIDWETTGTAHSVTSPESMSYGAISGNQITLGSASKIVQRITVDGTGKEYSLSFKAKKGSVGTATISLTNEQDSFIIELPDDEQFTWEDFSIAPFIPTMSYLDVSIETDDAVADFAITDLIINSGNSTVPWVQASGETLNTQVAITRNGVKVKSSVYSGDYVEITPLEFAGYSTASGSSQKVFSLNRDVTTVQKLHAEQQMEMPPIKIVPITSGDREGWAFVKIGN